ncbi:MAG: inner membrane protein YgaP [Pseudomonadota bacterium]|jgi:rhodanese-related sulfurtransferase
MTSTSHETSPTIGTTSPQAVRDQQSEALLLDVRTPAEFEEVHVEGAVLHPLTDLNPNHVKKLAEGKRACFLICRSGGRARQAAEKLSDQGLPTLTVMAGGMQAWESEGLPVTRGRKTISLERQVRIAAGALVVIGSALGYLVSPYWIVLSAFVGAGLMFAGITDTCGLAMVLARMPWNTRKPGKKPSCCSV